MSRKNNGSILIITVFVFLLVNIIAINCSALILSNTRYTRYDYEEVYMKEQCLGKIELIYSNILKDRKTVYSDLCGNTGKMATANGVIKTKML